MCFTTSAPEIAHGMAVSQDKALTVRRLLEGIRELACVGTLPGFTMRRLLEEIRVAFGAALITHWNLRSQLLPAFWQRCGWDPANRSSERRKRGKPSRQLLLLLKTAAFVADTERGFCPSL